MKLTSKTKVLLILNGVLLALILAEAVLLIFFVSAGGKIYPKAQQLDLRDKEVSLEVVDTLLAKLPDSEILWNVPFQGREYPSNTAQLTVTSLSEADLAMLKYFPELTTLNGQNCPDVGNLAAFQASRPQCRVLYQVTLGGAAYDQDTTALTLTGLTSEEALYLEALPQLTSLTVSGCEDYALLRQLQQEHPQWNLTYTVELGGQTLAWDTASAQLADVEGDALVNAMTGLPSLTSLELTNPRAQAQQLQALAEQYPQVDLRWSVNLFGTTYPMETTEVDISGNAVADYTQIAAVVASLPNLEKLIMSDCGIDNETMAQFREEQRDNYKVVWTVYLSDKTQCRTDADYFMPIQQGEYYFLDEDSYNLRYCEDLIVLDLGHHMIHNVDFLAFMPKLKYLILAHSGVRDISPIVNCQELVYLEIDWSEIQDYTPIAQLRSLEDLNLERTYCDVTPLLQMTWLKNLWIPGRSYGVIEELRAALPDTWIVTGSRREDGVGWRDLPNYFAMRDVLGMPYMK